MTYAGPQVDIPVGLPETPSTNIGAWQGLTIKEILEKVDLSNIIMEDDSKKNLAKNDPMVGHINPESAFLGPKLWSRPALSMPNNGGNEDYSVMNIDDFLSENGFDLNEEHESLGDSSEQEQSEIGIESPRSTSDMDMDQVETHQVSPVSSKKKNIPFKKRLSEQIELLKMKERDEVPYKKIKRVEFTKAKPAKEEPGENTFLYVESKRAKMEREKEEKRRRAQMEIEFSPQELALATVPGLAFDPRERKFQPDELRPQPIIRKRKKSFVPSEAKDDKYWDKREKNNVAARRSREARRLKENQIALRTAYLEKENNGLKAELEATKAENMELMAEKQMLIEKLKQYE